MLVFILFKAKTLWAVLLRDKVLNSHCAVGSDSLGLHCAFVSVKLEMLLVCWYKLDWGGERGEGKEYGLVRGAVDFWPAGNIVTEAIEPNEVFNGEAGVEDNIALVVTEVVSASWLGLDRHEVTGSGITDVTAIWATDSALEAVAPSDSSFDAVVKGKDQELSVDILKDALENCLFCVVDRGVTGIAVGVLGGDITAGGGGGGITPGAERVGLATVGVNKTAASGGGGKQGGVPKSSSSNDTIVSVLLLLANPGVTKEARFAVEVVEYWLYAFGSFKLRMLAKLWLLSGNCCCCWKLVVVDALLLRWRGREVKGSFRSRNNNGKLSIHTFNFNW